ncbi:unnamed protein product [Closterium sp. Naga37s-1]|nr:unnamed protein product [Closterium sp. Naga37s-1]
MLDALFELSSPPLVFPHPLRFPTFPHLPFPISPQYPGAAAVGLGAYGAHAFKPENPVYKEVWRTGNLYHLVHSAALLASPLVKRPDVYGSLLTFGIVAFSGSCYLSAAYEDRALGVMAPSCSDPLFPPPHPSPCLSPSSHHLLPVSSTRGQRSGRYGPPLFISLPPAFSSTPLTPLSSLRFPTSFPLLTCFTCYLSAAHEDSAPGVMAHTCCPPTDPLLVSLTPSPPPHPPRCLSARDESIFESTQKPSHRALTRLSDPLSPPSTHHPAYPLPLISCYLSAAYEDRALALPCPPLPALSLPQFTLPLSPFPSPLISCYLSAAYEDRALGVGAPFDSKPSRAPHFPHSPSPNSPCRSHLSPLLSSAATYQQHMRTGPWVLGLPLTQSPPVPPTSRTLPPPIHLAALTFPLSSHQLCYLSAAYEDRALGVGAPFDSKPSRAPHFPHSPSPNSPCRSHLSPLLSSAATYQQHMRTGPWVLGLPLTQSPPVPPTSRTLPPPIHLAALTFPLSSHQLLPISSI